MSRRLLMLLALWCTVVFVGGTLALGAHQPQERATVRTATAATAGPIGSPVASVVLTTAGAQLTETTTTSPMPPPTAGVPPTTWPLDPTTEPPANELPSGPIPGGTMPPTTPTTRPAVPAVYGRVTDSSGRPITDMCVLDFGKNVTQTTIGPDGSYAFWTLSAPFDPSLPQFLMVATCVGQSWGPLLNLPANVPSSPGRVDLVVYERPFLAGMVIDPHDVPIAGVCVVETAGPEGAPTLPNMVTDSHGFFGPIEGLDPGVYTFEVRLTCLGPTLEPDGRTPTMSISADPNASGRTDLSVHRLLDVLPAP